MEGRAGIYAGSAYHVGGLAGARVSFVHFLR